MADETALDDEEFAANTLADYIEIIDGDLDEAVDKLNKQEIEELCRAVRQKIDRIADEYLSQPTPARDRWWDR